MNDQVKALIARLRDYPNGSLDPETRLGVADALEAAQPQGEYHEGLEEGIKIGRAEATQQAPAVDRQALISSLANAECWEKDDVGGWAFVPELGADRLFASGILQDAAVLSREVEARGLEKAAGDQWREYVEPCPDSGREHDCTFDYLMRWEVGQFLAWLASVRADAWDEAMRAAEEVDGPNYLPNPYRSKKQ